MSTTQSLPFPSLNDYMEYLYIYVCVHRGMNVCMNVKQLKRILINEKMLDEKKKMSIVMIVHSLVFNFYFLVCIL